MSFSDEQYDPCTRRPTPDSSEALEQVRSARVNLANLGKAVGPLLRAHPFYRIVEMQLANTEKALSGTEPMEVSV